MVSVSRSLQERLTASLAAVGYKKDAGILPASLESNPKLLNFLEWTVSQIECVNHVTTEQAKSFETLRSEGKVLEGPALQNALGQLGSGAESCKDMAQTVADMGAKAAALKDQLHTLNSVQQSLTEHYAFLLHKRDELTRQKLNLQRRCHKSLQKAEDGNRNIDVARQDLMSAVRELCGSHRRERESTSSSSDGHQFLSDLPQDSYHEAEDRYLAELTAYSKKQFFKGLAGLAHTQAPGEEESKFSSVDLDDLDQVILRGVSEEQHQKHQRELTRLQTLYPLTEMQRINAVLAQGQAEAAALRAKQEMQLLTQTPASDVDGSSLLHLVAKRKQRVVELHTCIQELGQRKLTFLLQDMAALQVTHVLHGNYDLKLARQDYFISKQDQVISCLQSQRARHELLSMLYEVELRKHRDTHRLLATTEKMLAHLKEEWSKRMAAMENPSLQRVEKTRLAIDSRDTFSQNICALLELKPDGTFPLLSYAGLKQGVEHLAHQIATLGGVLAASDSEMDEFLTKQKAVFCDLERELFCGEQAGVPVLSPREYEKHCADLSCVVSSLELNIKKLLKDYDGKKKVLKADPLLQTEKKLFVHFFNNPTQLSVILGELAKKIDLMTQTLHLP